MPFRPPFLFLALACALIAAKPPHADAAADFTPVQREAIEGIIRDYLMHNPDVLIEALRGAEDRLNREADARAEKFSPGGERRCSHHRPAGNSQGYIAAVSSSAIRENASASWVVSLAR